MAAAFAIALVASDDVLAAPALQLPWPTGQVHRINSAGSGYGCDFHQGATHYALDFDHTTGQAVSAVAAGTAHSGSHAELGNYVWIAHGGGLVSVYAHFSSFAGGFPRTVAQGEVVGAAGNTGASTGAHLHFVMRSGATGPFNGSAFLPEPMSGYGGFGAYGCGRGTSPPYTSQPPVGEGSFVARSGSPEVYRIAGGAPIYVSNWAHYGGPQPVTALSPAEFDGLRAVPANGTFVHSVQDGAVYRIAGGAPIYVSTWDTYGGTQPTVGIDKWAVDNIEHPAAHMRAVPDDGTLVSTNQDGAVYRVAGGAPIYVSTWDALGGPQPTVGIDKWAVDNPSHPAAHLRSVPADGTFLNSSSGAVYRVAGGAPIYLSDWALFGGVRHHVTVDNWAIVNAAHPAAHLNRVPRDGTRVRGLPSQAHWRFESGTRTPSPAEPNAVDVDDVGLAAFSLSSTASPQGAATSTTPPPGGAGAQSGAEDSAAGRVAVDLRSLMSISRRATIERILKRRRYSARFHAPGAGTLDVVWTKGAKRVVVARAHVVFTKASTRRVSLNLTKAGARILRRAGRVKLAARARFTPASGAPVTARRVVSLRRAKLRR